MKPISLNEEKADHCQVGGSQCVIAVVPPPCLCLWEWLVCVRAAQMEAFSHIPLLEGYNRPRYCSFLLPADKASFFPDFSGHRRDVFEQQHPSSPASLLLLPHPFIPFCKVKCHSGEGN